MEHPLFNLALGTDLQIGYTIVNHHHDMYIYLYIKVPTCVAVLTD